MKVLYIAYYDPKGLPFLKSNIEYHASLSVHDVEVFNLFHNPSLSLMLPAYLDINDYDVLIAHPTVSYFSSNLKSLDQQIETKLSDFQGLKILMKQDEHVKTHEIAKLVKEKGFDLILTCLSPSEQKKAYPHELTGDVDFFQTLTSYVTPQLRNREVRRSKIRPFRIGYRGSMQPLICGQLGFEKWKIGEDVAERCKVLGIDHDISSRWEDRINGEKWFEFLENCDAVLGVESGSNVFDFIGTVEVECKEFLDSHKDLDPESEEFYRKLHKEVLHKYEGNVKYNQISPRHFEAAATKTLQILYEGDYSNIFLPWKHYLPLKKDMSNFDDIIKQAQDPEVRRKITEAAYNDIVRNPSYSIESFVKELDIKIDEGIEKKMIRLKKKYDKATVLMVVPHKLEIDPRVKWAKYSLSQNFYVHAVGTYCGSWQEKSLTGNATLHENQLEANVNYNIGHMLLSNEDLWNEQDLSFWFMYLKEVSDVEFSLIGQLDDHQKVRLKWLVDHTYKNANILFHVGDRVKKFDCIFAVDLISLLPAAMLAKKYNVPLVYDAHEFWPISDPDFSEPEVNFWKTLEKSLLTYVDLATTVSPQLAKEMELAYDGHKFMSVPNAGLISISENVCPAFKKENKSEVVKFLFLGNYAPHRGIDLLIENWDAMPKDCHLHLQGPMNPYAEKMYQKAELAGLLNKTIFFEKPVSEDELVLSASQYDVGIIPYSPHSSPIYKYCCPNKLSQYMAAGLPIIANTVEFVGEVLSKAQCGISVDFLDKKSFVNKFSSLARDEEKRKKLGKNAYEYFHNEFNWERQSHKFFDLTNQLITIKKIANPSLLTKLSEEINRNLSAGVEENHWRLNIYNFIERYSNTFVYLLKKYSCKILRIDFNPS